MPALLCLEGKWLECKCEQISKSIDACSHEFFNGINYVVTFSRSQERTFLTRLGERIEVTEQQHLDAAAVHVRRVAPTRLQRRRFRLNDAS